MPPERFWRPVPIPVKGAPIKPCCEAVPESPDRIAHGIASDILKGWAERGRCGKSDVPDPEETSPAYHSPGPRSEAACWAGSASSAGSIVERGFEYPADLSAAIGADGIRGVSPGYARLMDLDATGRLAAEVDPSSRSKAGRVPRAAG